MSEDIIDKYLVDVEIDIIKQEIQSLGTTVTAQRIAGFRRQREDDMDRIAQLEKQMDISSKRNAALIIEIEQVKAERDDLQKALFSNHGYNLGKQKGMERAAEIAEAKHCDICSGLKHGIAQAIRDASTSKSEDSSQLSNIHHKVP